jgi:hypothetical protein
MPQPATQNPFTKKNHPCDYLSNHEWVHENTIPKNMVHTLPIDTYSLDVPTLQCPSYDQSSLYTHLHGIVQCHLCKTNAFPFHSCSMAMAWYMTSKIKTS